MAQSAEKSEQNHKSGKVLVYWIINAVNLCSIRWHACTCSIPSLLVGAQCTSEAKSARQIREIAEQAIG